MAKYSVVVLIGTGGKGTGAGTMLPLAQMARGQRKLVLPVFVRPSFERHEVDKRRYDHALQVAAEFDAARIRLIEILNDRAYSADDPQPQEVVWERMNLPIARGLRGLVYVLWDLSQVDPSDLSILLAGHGRMRIGFAEIDPAGAGRSERHGNRRSRSRLLAERLLRIQPAGWHVARLHPGRLVESGGREDQGRHCSARARRHARALVQPAVRPSVPRAEAVGCHRSVHRVHRRSTSRLRSTGRLTTRRPPALAKRFRVDGEAPALAMVADGVAAVATLRCPGPIDARRAIVDRADSC